MLPPLKPCPFCQSTDIQIKYWLDIHGQYFFIKCNYCQCFGPRFLNLIKEPAIPKACEAWNKR